MTFNANGQNIGRTYQINNVMDSAMLDTLLWDVLDMMASGDHYCAKMTWEAFNLPTLGTMLPASIMDSAETARVNARNRKAAAHRAEIASMTAYARWVARQD